MLKIRISYYINSGIKYAQILYQNAGKFMFLISLRSFLKKKWKYRKDVYTFMFNHNVYCRLRPATSEVYFLYNPTITMEMNMDTWFQLIFLDSKFVKLWGNMMFTFVGAFCFVIVNSTSFRSYLDILSDCFTDASGKLNANCKYYFFYFLFCVTEVFKNVWNHWKFAHRWCVVDMT